MCSRVEVIFQKEAEKFIVDEKDIYFFSVFQPLYDFCMTKRIWLFYKYPN